MPASTLRKKSIALELSESLLPFVVFFLAAITNRRKKTKVVEVGQWKYFVFPYLNYIKIDKICY